MQIAAHQLWIAMENFEHVTKCESEYCRTASEGLKVQYNLGLYLYIKRLPDQFVKRKGYGIELYLWGWTPDFH